MKSFLDYKKYVPTENRPLLVITKWDEQRTAIYNERFGHYNFTDCDHPMANVHLDMYSTKGWRYVNEKDNEDALFSVNHYQIQRDGDEIMASIKQKNILFTNILSLFKIKLK